MIFMRFAFLLHLVAIFAADPKPLFVVKVNGVAISKADVEFAASKQGLSEEQRTAAETKLVEELIDLQLLRGFLAAKKVEPNADELQFQIAGFEELIRNRGEDPQKLLTKLGYTPDRLKRELGLPIAWQAYARRSITPMQVKEYFDAHQQELDGTQLRGSHIFLQLPKGTPESEIASKKNQMADIRREIIDGQLSFADAAKKYSEAPTGKQGGDLGLFGWRASLPASVSEAAFALKVNEITKPIVSPLGLHLIQVTERHPGEFSLEDVRSVIQERLSQQLRTKTVAEERAKARLEWGKP